MKTLINTGLKAEDIEAIKRVMQPHPGIISVVLYGSRAKGNYRNNSDIDLCLIAPNMNYSEFSQISLELDDLMLPYDIDLSLQHHIENQELLEHIARVGKPL